jgi:hypothetical protein
LNAACRALEMGAIGRGVQEGEHDSATDGRAAVGACGKCCGQKGLRAPSSQPAIAIPTITERPYRSRAGPTWSSVERVGEPADALSTIRADFAGDLFPETAQAATAC